MTQNARLSDLVERLSKQDGVHLDRHGCVQTTRKLQLDGPLPPELIPMKIMRLLHRYTTGQLNSRPRSALYEARKVLRRYAMLPEDKPRPLNTTSDAREQRRAYKREWRRRRGLDGYAVL